MGKIKLGRPFSILSLRRIRDFAWAILRWNSRSVQLTAYELQRLFLWERLYCYGGLTTDEQTELSVLNKIINDVPREHIEQQRLIDLELMYEHIPVSSDINWQLIE